MSAVGARGSDAQRSRKAIQPRARALAYLAVNVALVREQKVLLLRRRGTGWRDGWYTLVSGHVEDESLENCGVREVREEVGVEVSPADLQPAHALLRRESGAQWLDFFYRCERFEGEPYLAEPHRADALVWADLTRLPRRLVPHARVGMEQIAERSSQTRRRQPFSTLVVRRRP